jgi:hypothetical protein
MTMKIGLVLSLATFLGLATGCAPATTGALSSHATFASAPEHSSLSTLPSAARPLEDPRPETAKVAAAPDAARVTLPPTGTVMASRPTVHM